MNNKYQNIVLIYVLNIKIATFKISKTEMTATTTSEDLQNAVFNQHQQHALRKTWQHWQNSNSGGRNGIVYVFNEEEWLKRRGEPMELIKDLEFLRRRSFKSCQDETKWVHRLVQTQFWDDLIKKDQIDLMRLAEIQEKIDNFKADMKAYKEINPRVHIEILYTELDAFPLQDKMEDYLSRPYECNRILTSASIINQARPDLPKLPDLPTIPAEESEWALFESQY